jgi:hypothetical protein
MERLQIHSWPHGAGLGPEYSGSPLKKLRLPLRDLIDVNVELLRQFDQRLLALALNAGLWFRRTCFVIVSPDPQPPWPLSGKNSTYPTVQICRATSVVGVETQPMSLLDVGKWRIERKENFSVG